MVTRELALPGWYTFLEPLSSSLFAPEQSKRVHHLPSESRKREGRACEGITNDVCGHGAARAEG